MTGAVAVIETGRLRLVPLTRGDATDLFAVLNDPSLHEFIGGEPLGEAALAERYARLEARRWSSGAGRRVQALVARDDKQV